MKEDPIEFKISFLNSRINSKPQPIQEFKEWKEFDKLTRNWNMVTKHVEAIATYGKLVPFKMKSCKFKVPIIKCNIPSTKEFPLNQNWKPLSFRKNKFKYKLLSIKNLKWKTLKQDEEEAEEEKIQLWEENGHNVQKRLARFRERYCTWHFLDKIIEPKLNNYSAQTILSILNAHLNGIPQSDAR
jgi:hypothetical protein